MRCRLRSVIVETERSTLTPMVLSDMITRHLPFPISAIQAACPGISRDMVRVVSRAMKAQGLIAPTGKGRGAKWQHTGAKVVA